MRSLLVKWYHSVLIAEEYTKALKCHVVRTLSVLLSIRAVSRTRYTGRYHRAVFRRGGKVIEKAVPFLVVLTYKMKAKIDFCPRPIYVSFRRG